MSEISTITASQYWQKVGALMDAKGRTEFQRQEAVRAFEKDHANVRWRIRLIDVSQFGTIDCWASKQGYRQSRKGVSRPAATRRGAVF